MDPVSMAKTDFRHAIAEYIRREAQPPDKYSHQPRLYQLARSLARGESFDDDVLYAAAWMHDLGVFLGHRPQDLDALACWDHIGYVLNAGPGILRQVGFPEAKIAAVSEAIRTHLPSGEPTNVEGVLLRDADILEQLGAIGILRTVSKSGATRAFRLIGRLWKCYDVTRLNCQGASAWPRPVNWPKRDSPFFTNFWRPTTMKPADWS